VRGAGEPSLGADVGGVSPLSHGADVDGVSPFQSRHWPARLAMQVGPISNLLNTTPAKSLLYECIHTVSIGMTQVCPVWFGVRARVRARARVCVCMCVSVSVCVCLCK
jgi:hypothetical protein